MTEHIIDYGAVGMSDYLIHKDEKRRKFYQCFKDNKGFNDRNWLILEHPHRSRRSYRIPIFCLCTTLGLG